MISEETDAVFDMRYQTLGHSGRDYSNFMAILENVSGYLSTFSSKKILVAIHFGVKSCLSVCTK